MEPLAIAVKNLSKKYKIGLAQQRDDTLRDTIVSLVKKASARIFSPGRQTHADELWALQGVSFDVPQGQVVGLIGRNGAGKSTLLKILARITEPTGGRAVINGRVGSLLEVGTGFHPELTGRENIYLNGAILGMRQAEIERKFDEMVAFSEIEKFLDTPVKRYSSGMQVRLAFSVAAHLEPEILLVDEVLAVGDAQFQKKCLGKMSDVARAGRTVVLVSHNMAAINQLCQRALWIDAGQLREDGQAAVVVSHYLLSSAETEGQRVWDEGIASPGVAEFTIRAVRIKNVDLKVTSALDVQHPFWIEIEYEVIKSLPFSRVGCFLTTIEGITVFESYDSDQKEDVGRREPGTYISRCKIPANLLNPGRYILTINAGLPGIKNLARIENVLSFDIEDTGAVGSHLQAKRQGVIRPMLEWDKIKQ
jgi:lipopolysaccharide transport system ATP-binding protein